MIDVVFLFTSLLKVDLKIVQQKPHSYQCEKFKGLR